MRKPRSDRGPYAAALQERGHILVRIGKAPKRAIPFRTEVPFAKITANVVAPHGRTEKIEFLGDGQQVVAFGIHPETKQRYNWHGGEPDKSQEGSATHLRGRGAPIR